MKVSPTLLVILVALAVSAGTAAARDYPRPGPVTSVGTSEFAIAYAMEVPKGCHEVRVWHSNGRDRRVARHCFPATSTGSGISAVAYSKGRALYLAYAGGNIRDWMLYTKGESAPRRIAFQSRDVDAPPPIVVAQSSEWALAYAVGSRIVAFDERGKRLFDYDAGAPVTALSTQQRGIAAVLESGRAIGLAYNGKLVAARDHAPGAAQTAELTAQGLLIKTRTAVELRSPSVNRTFPVPAGARWLGFASGRFAYVVGSSMYLGRVSDGKQALYRRFAAPFVGQVGRITIATASGRTLSRENAVDAVARVFG